MGSRRLVGRRTRLALVVAALRMLGGCDGATVVEQAASSSAAAGGSGPTSVGGAHASGQGGHDHGGQPSAGAGGVETGGATAWARRFGGHGHQRATSIGVDSQGNLLLTGFMEETVDFGGGVMTSGGGFPMGDAFIVKLDPFGNHIWSMSSGAPGSDAGWQVATDSNDNVIVSGQFTGLLDFGGAPLQSVGPDYDDVFIAKFDPDGAHLWSSCFGDVSQWDMAWGLAIDASDSVIVAGNFDGTIDLGGGPLTSAGGVFGDAFIAKLDPSGSHLWSLRAGDDESQRVLAAGVDAAGAVFVTGDFHGVLDLGGEPLVAQVDAYDMFVAKLDATGEHVWSSRFGGPGGEFGYAIAAIPGQGVVVSGAFQETIDFGGGVLTAPASEWAIFVVALDELGGHLWSRSFGGTDGALDELQIGTSLAVDSAGDIFLVGRMKGTVDFGGGALTSAGGLDLFVAKFSSAGEHVYSRSFGNRLWNDAADVAIGKSGGAVLAGQLYGTIDFGLGPLVSADGDDTFVLELAP